MNNIEPDKARKQTNKIQQNTPMKKIITDANLRLQVDGRLTPYQQLVLSSITGENFTQVDERLQDIVSQIVNHSNFKEKNIIQTYNGKTYLIGQTLPINYSKLNNPTKGKWLTCIEMIITNTSSLYKGNTPIEILLEQTNTIIQETLNDYLETTPISNSIIDIDNRDKLNILLKQNKDMIFTIGNKIIICQFNNGTMKIQVIKDIKTPPLSFKNINIEELYEIMNV